MMLTNKEQLMQLFLSLGFGLWLNLYYCLVRHIPLQSPHREFKRGLCDWIFVTSSGIVFFFFSLAVNAGNVRLGMLLAVTVGFAVSECTVGRLFRVFLSALSRIRHCITRSLQTFGRCVGKLTAILRKKSTIFLKKGLHSFRSMVYNQK